MPHVVIPSREILRRVTDYLALEKCLKKLEYITGVHPRHFGSPKNTITPEQVIRHHRSKRKGGKGGQARSPQS